MFIQTSGPLAACLLNDCVLKKMFVVNLGAPWSPGAWGPGPNGPVVNPPLILLSILVCAAASLFCVCLVSVQVSAP